MPGRHAKFWLVAIIVLTVIGFADATFLTVEHFRGGTIPCLITSGCETVTTSRYSSWGPVPVALAGAIFYLVILVLTVAYLESGYAKLKPVIFVSAAIAWLGSLRFVYLQAFVLHAYCFYCLVSATAVTLILLCTIGARWYRV